MEKPKDTHRPYQWGDLAVCFQAEVILTVSLRCPVVSDSILVERSSDHSENHHFPILKGDVYHLENLAKHHSTQEVLVTMKTNPEKVNLWISQNWLPKPAKDPNFYKYQTFLLSFLFCFSYSY